MRDVGEAQWYALRVQPQKEYVVSYLLRKQGVATFIPTELRTQKRSSYSKGKAEFAVPVIPGVVFAGFAGAPAWYDVLRNTLIVGPEGMDGKPWRLDFVRLLEFFARSLDGSMILDEGIRLIRIPGKGDVRSMTTRVKSISHRARTSPKPKTKDQPVVYEVKGKHADFLSRFTNGNLV